MGTNVGGPYVYLETHVFELKSVPEAEAQIEVLEIEGIVLKDVEPGHGIAEQTLWHGRGAEGLEDAGHDGDAWAFCTGTGRRDDLKLVARSRRSSWARW